MKTNFEHHPRESQTIEFHSIQDFDRTHPHTSIMVIEQAIEAPKPVCDLLPTRVTQLLISHQ